MDGNKNQVTLKREIGLFGGISIIGGIMIGSGIFYLGSYVLVRANMSMGMALLCWVMGGVVSLLGGLCFAELGAARPKAGGTVVYLNEAYHPVVGYMSGFTSLLLSGAGSISALAIALPTAFKGYWNLSDVSVKIMAIALIWLLTAFNCLGIKQGSILQNISMVAKLVPIVAIILAAIFSGKQSPDLSLAVTDAEGKTMSVGGIFGMIAFATLATLWAYEGWMNLNCVAEEMKRPGKDLPRALFITIGGIVVIYTLFNFAIYKVLPYNEVVEMIEDDNIYLGTEVAKRVFGGFGSTLVLSTMAIAMFSAINGMIIAFPRNYYAMGREGHFFRFYGTLSKRSSVPVAAIIGQAIISSVLVLLRNLDQLTSLVIFSGMVFNVLTVLAVVVYRKKYPDMERPYKVAGYPVTVILSVLLFAGLMVNTFMEDPVTAVIGLAVPAVGAVTYFVFDAVHKREKAELEAEAEPEAESGIVAMSGAEAGSETDSGAEG